MMDPLQTTGLLNPLQTTSHMELYFFKYIFEIYEEKTPLQE